MECNVDVDLTIKAFVYCVMLILLIRFELNLSNVITK